MAMSTYHDRTLALLGLQGNVRARPVPKLVQWATESGIALPAAYLEWAQLDGEAILSTNSNTDAFYFEQPEIVVTPNGVRGLLFNRESQGNFDKIIVLDGDDDPPVLFACIGKPPWVKYADHFSACVYAQIFDWQYMPDNQGAFSLRTDRCITFLRRNFTETVTTHFVMDDRYYTEYRFFKSAALRLTVLVEDTARPTDEGVAHIMITGANREVVVTEAELLEALSDEVVPESFSFLASALGELARMIDYRLPAQVRHMPIEKASADAVDRLNACHRAQPLKERVQGNFPKAGELFAVGGADWGVTIEFRRRNANWWWIQRIVLTS
jgi:hypothetical protein